MPMIMKSRSKNDIERRKKEALNRGHKILGEGTYIDNGYTIYWVKINNEHV
jgi:hypothetical protein